LYEELTTDEELRRTLELDELYAVLPAFRNIYNGISYSYPDAQPAKKVQNSATEVPVSRAVLRDFLLQPGVLPSQVAALSRAASRDKPRTIASPKAPVRPRPLQPAVVLQPKFA
jgi:hypothetical protein